MNSIQLILNQKYLDLKSRNPRLSHRYFAKKLGLSSGALSEILKGKRKVSEKLAGKLATRLHLDPKTAAEFVGSKDPRDDFQNLDYFQLEDDQFHLISDWPHYAILNLIKSEKCQHRVEWFGEQLNLSSKVVRETLDRLLRLNMISYERKKFVRTKGRLSTSDDVHNLSIQKSNLEDLEMIREHLSTLSVTERDLTSVTLLIDPKKMPELKRWIRRIQDSFVSKFEATRSPNPFRLTVALFPLKAPLK